MKGSVMPLSPVTPGTPIAGDARRAARRYIGTAGIADIIGTKTSTVRSYRRKGMLPPAAAYVDGEAVGWTPESIRRWHASRPSQVSA